ncbi:hypothetical protein LWF15_19680 [Kineosporia rhizophila]|uniref:hypothetical protein n=1 Tax=Kineosporia rhizophila TaxID=84633 RepID=UPI001E4BD950|nr:hypothetical protein [Kineosporia rhizophila]MCE0537716.1 hypothetical protein [Kineosporia rhizophila]
MSADDGLARLLRREETISDLLAFLTQHDPQPLPGLLGLPPGTYEVARERPLGSAARVDLLVLDAEGQPAAVLEIRAGATESGHQRARLEAWAPTSGLPLERLFFVTLARVEAPRGWTSLALGDVFAAWESSPEAGWLAQRIGDELKLWQTQADGRLGELSGWFAPDLLLQRLATELDQRLAAVPATETRRTVAGSTSGGQPQLIAWLRPAGYDGQIWASVELRAQGRAEAGGQPWSLRPCVDATAGPAPTDQILTEVHQSSLHLREHLSFDAVAAHLQVQGRADLAHHLQPGQYGGDLDTFDAAAVTRWYELALGGRRPRLHPFFFHDRGRRMGTQFRLAVHDLDRTDLGDLITIVLQHLSDGLHT